MADEIRCPMCSKMNPADLDTCQYCQARLKPLEGPSSEESIHPGEKPTKKSTAELEQVLPEWLKQVRQEGREASNEPETPPAEETPPENKETDWLSGLQSQAETDNEEGEEVPDWLTSLRPDTLSGSKEDAEAESLTWEGDLGSDQDEAAFGDVQLPGEEKTPSESIGSTEEVPDRLSNLTGGETSSSPSNEPENRIEPVELPGKPENVDQPEPAAEATNDAELPNWLSDLDSGSTQEPSAEAIEAELPDWLGSQKPASEETDDKDQASEAHLPDFLSGEPTEDLPAASSGIEVSDELPDWLGGQQPTNQETEDQAPEEALPDFLSSTPTEDVSPVKAGGFEESDELPGWLTGDSNQPEASSSTEGQFTASDESPESLGEVDIPDWLQDVKSEEASSTAASAFETEGGEESELPIDEGVPDWLNNMAAAGEPPADSDTPALTGFDEPSEESGTPDWLSSLGTQKEIEEQANEPGEASAPAEQAEQLPDWLSNLPSEPQAETEETSETSGSPAFVSDAGPVDANDLDAMLASDMPEWLSHLGPTEKSAEGGQESAEAQDDSLNMVELPSWVQAMRPVESVVPDASATTEETDEGPLEKEGPLAGLRGVLPAVAAFTPSSKPKAYSIKLDANENQQAHAALLEQVLASEAQPSPITSEPTVLSQRLLRWVIFALVFIVAGLGLAINQRVAPLPTYMPVETMKAKEVIDGLDSQAQVLLVTDYDAAYAGEMEATSTPLILQSILLKQARFTIVSTTPTGPALAEKLMQNATSDLSYIGTDQYVNLGYIPGGLAGVYDFASAPVNTINVSTDGRIAQDTPPLQGITNLSDFAAIVVITDNAESGRVWIEQTTKARKDTPLLMLASTQAEPMLRPYVDSQQISGMVTGLAGGTAYEQVIGYAGLGNHYWNAYSLGLFVAVMLIIVGSIWNLIVSWQARRAEQMDEEEDL